MQRVGIRIGDGEGNGNGNWIVYLAAVQRWERRTGEREGERGCGQRLVTGSLIDLYSMRRVSWLHSCRCRQADV